MMPFNRRSRWIFSFVLLATVALVAVMQTSADDPPLEPANPEQPYNSLELNKMTEKERAQVVQRMSLAEKESLRKKWDQFKGLDENAKAKNRQLHSQIIADPQSDRLHQVMVRYHEWLSGLRSRQRADLLSLPAEERIKRIQQIIREQEQRKFAELLEKELPANDLTSISKWLEESLDRFAGKIKDNEAEIMASFSSEHRTRLEQISDPQQRRRLMAMGALYRGRLDSTESPLTKLLSIPEEFQRLRGELSSRGQELFDQAEGSKEQMVLVRQWVRATLMSRRKALPRVSDETLAAFRRGELVTDSTPDFKLKPEDQERLEHLSGERLKQQLKWYYYRYRGDLEPGGTSRSGSRTGRSGGGRRGSGRTGGGSGRPRPPERDSSQFIDRPVVPLRSR
jgi:hypothetical protein